MTIDPLNVDVEIRSSSTSRPIGSSCSRATTSPYLLVVSTVTLDGAFGGTHENLIDFVPANLGALGVTQGDLCGIPGATFGDLPDATYTLSAIVPKAS